MDANWRRRQAEMENWYREFAKNDAAAERLREDYHPFAQTLATLRDSVIDIGGGAGVAGRYLASSAEYVVLDPSAIWLGAEWVGILDRIATSGPKPRFVAGAGESLPFGSNRFEAALALWSLNHAADPERCAREMHRVLKPGGLALIVLEDMEPSWADAARRALQSLLVRAGRQVQMLDWRQPQIRTTLSTLRHKLSGRAWPLQSDHLRIKEREFRRWFKGFRIVHRTWDGGYLSFQLMRR